MDTIFIRNLRLACRVGVTKEERRKPQPVLVDVELLLDLSGPASSEMIEETVDYREARRQVSDLVTKGEFTLLESLAEETATLLLENFEVQRVAVRARKAKYSTEPSIGVEIERSREA